MQTTALPTGVTSPAPSVAVRRTWSLPHYLAVTGVLSLVWGACTVIPWLAHGVHQVTEYRDRDDASWYAARVYEALAVLVSIVMATVVVRRCRRERRFTFDAQFCLAWFTLYWIDPALNMVSPIWMYSSNWVNVANWCGHMPLVRNVDCGRLPEPVLFLWPLYTFGFLAFVIGMNVVMAGAKRRRPTLSTAKLVLLAVAGGAVVDLLLELPMYHLHLWGFPGSPHELAIMDGTNRYPLVQILFGIMVFTPCALLRYCKDDRGRVITERRLEAYSPRVRTITSTLAVYGFTTIVGVVVTLGSVAAGFYADPYPKMPAHLVNGMCDSPGISGTAYGPCPGGDGKKDGWNIPVRRLAGQ